MNALYNSTSSGFYKSFQVEGENIVVSILEQVTCKRHVAGCGGRYGRVVAPLLLGIHPTQI